SDVPRSDVPSSDFVDDRAPELAVVPAIEPMSEPITAETDLAPIDRFFYALSSAADHGLLWLLLGATRAARKGDPAIVLRFGALLSAESLLTNGVLKLAFRRVRPPDHFTHTAERRDGVLR